MLNAIDHVVLTVRDIDATIHFYEQALGTPVIRFGSGRYALQIGSQKLNLHHAGEDYEPIAKQPTAGAIDICFLTDDPITDITERLAQHGVQVELGPCDRTGAVGPLRSIYVRDPDGNLIEIANQT